MAVNKGWDAPDGVVRIGLVEKVAEAERELQYAKERLATYQRLLAEHDAKQGEGHEKPRQVRIAR